MSLVATDLTPLHFAILSRSASQVRKYLLQTPVVAATNAVLTPVECCLGWPEGFPLLAMAGYSAITAVQLAITRQDVASVGHILAARFPLFVDGTWGRANSDHWWGAKGSMLNATLCPHCQSTWDRSRCQSQTELCSCSIYGHQETNSQARQDIRNLIIEAVGERRARLTGLALQSLSSQTLDELGIRGSGRPLDMEAFAAYTALQHAGVAVPESLYPGRQALLLSFNPWCASGGFSLAQKLFDTGFCEVNVSFGNFTPLTRLFNQPAMGGQKAAVIRWYLEQGASPTFADPGMLPNFLFYLATVYDRSSLYEDAPHARLAICSHLKQEMKFVVARRQMRTNSAMIQLVSQFCDPLQRDACRCPCSYGGCLPLHKFKSAVDILDAPADPDLEIRDDVRRFGWLPHRWDGLSDTVRAWMQDCCLGKNQKREYLRDACRLEVFTRLGMAHLCCVFGCARSDHDSFPSRQERDPETVQELEAEDVELREQLELIMEAYDKALVKYRGTLDEFWEWWWGTLEPVLPEIPSRQRRRTFGDYSLNSTCCQISRREKTDHDWDFYWPEEETKSDGEEGEDENQDNGIQGGRRMDFIDEIREYFANILSQASLGRMAHEHLP